MDLPCTGTQTTTESQKPFTKYSRQKRTATCDFPNKGAKPYNNATSGIEYFIAKVGIGIDRDLIQLS